MQPGKQDLALARHRQPALEASLLSAAVALLARQRVQTAPEVRRVRRRPPRLEGHLQRALQGQRCVFASFKSISKSINKDFNFDQLHYRLIIIA